MFLSPSELAVSGTLGGVAITATASVIITLINKRSEERNHLKKLLMDAAVEQYKQDNIRFVESMKLDKSVKLLPLDTYIIHLMKLSEVLLDSEITKETIADKLRQIHEVADEVGKFNTNALAKERKSGALTGDNQ